MSWFGKTVVYLTIKECKHYDFNYVHVVDVLGENRHSTRKDSSLTVKRTLHCDVDRKITVVMTTNVVLYF